MITIEDEHKPLCIFTDEQLEKDIYNSMEKFKADKSVGKGNYFLFEFDFIF